jgi:hypothetical protein
MLFLIVLPATIFISIGCNPPPIPGAYGGRTTQCEDSIAAAKQNCKNALTDWVVNCDYNPLSHQCICIGLFYIHCQDVLDIQAYCGNCPAQAYNNANIGLRFRERDTIGKLVAKIAGETLL